MVINQNRRKYKNPRRCRFCVRAVVPDNHSDNVNAFSSLKKEYESDSSYIEHPSNHGKKTYLFFDSVHLVKNLRNNLLNGKKFVFPSFDFDDGNISVNCPAGYISWSDLHTIYDKDQELQGNLKKAHKLSYRSLNPGNNKQDVSFALSIFDESTIAAVKSYLPKRDDVISFRNFSEMVYNF